LNADPGNAVFRRGQSVVETQWAAALRGAGHIAEGVAHNQKALRLAMALSQDAPKSAQYRTDVGVDERKLSDGLLAAGDAAASLHHAEQASEILCQNASAAINVGNLTHCGRSHLSTGNAYLALNNPKAAETALQKAETIAAAQSKTDPINAILRSDSARAQAALAAALVQTGDERSARTMYETALTNWSTLRQANAISADDAYRSNDAALAFAKLHSQH
jgi:tetratricopeptide (TPR) repeat protein